MTTPSTKNKSTYTEDPDEQVRRAVEDFFAEFQRTGSALQTVRTFHDTGRLFSQLGWSDGGIVALLVALCRPDGG